MAGTVKARSLFDVTIVRQAIVDSFRKLTPRRQVRNPVMFVVYVGSILTTLLWVQALVGQGEAPGWFIFWVSVWLWFTVLFANFAEAMAEGRGKAQAASLRKARLDLQAKRLTRPGHGAKYELVSASTLRKGHVVLVEAGDSIPAHRHAPAVHALQRRGGGTGDTGDDDRARRVARVPHPHHDRGAPVGDRHRRDGSHDPEERHRDVGAGRGGRWRRRRPAA